MACRPEDARQPLAAQPRVYSKGSDGLASGGFTPGVLAVRVLVQRVSHASVAVAGKPVGAIERGLLLFVGFTHTDSDAALTSMADKVCGLRIFPDDDDKMNRSVLDVSGGLLVVSQFTLYGDAAKGKRPSFIDAARPEQAVPLYEAFVARLRERAPRVETGEFGAHMEVSLVNDGPVTLWLER